ncbi:MAG: undecaprenyldiphospho-muramoylpentapeptide beta-N-acetylglucosaminyltransferase [Parcubacteria group bacterium]
MKVILTGGGTMGAVNPLLAIKEKLAEQQICSDFLWIGTKDGIEKELIAKENVPYQAISSAKLRRYFSWRNLAAPFVLIVAFFQAIFIIKKYHPDFILSAGGFVSVPVIWAGALLNKKSIIHQQDLCPGLANKLMAPFAYKITVAFESSLQNFPNKKTVFTGNPVRTELFSGSKDGAIKRFNLENNLPTVLILGGSLGAEKINELATGAIVELIKVCQIIHVTGKGNVIEWVDREKFKNFSRYQAYEYLSEELFDAYAAADLVVSRAGLSTLTELSVLAKPTVLIPIPDNQQEENAKYFAGRNAAVILDQSSATALEFAHLILDLLSNKASLERLSQNIKEIMLANAAENFVRLIVEPSGNIDK